MKLLLDENISHRLVHALTKIGFETLHVEDIGLDQSDDSEIWNHCKQHCLAIVSKDSDFVQRALVNAPPPKVIWANIGNCLTSTLFELIASSKEEILDFLADPEETLFPLL